MISQRNSTVNSYFSVFLVYLLPATGCLPVSSWSWPERGCSCAAAALGITPVLICANPDADVETKYLKIKDLRELIQG